MGALHRYAESIVRGGDGEERGRLAACLAKVCFGEGAIHSELAVAMVELGDGGGGDDSVERCSMIAGSFRTITGGAALPVLR